MLSAELKNSAFSIRHSAACSIPYNGAWGSRLRACGASARQGCRDVAREASEVGIVPDYVKERKLPAFAKASAGPP
jgi:hypothetical protein